MTDGTYGASNSGLFHKNCLSCLFVVEIGARHGKCPNLLWEILNLKIVSTCFSTLREKVYLIYKLSAASEPNAHSGILQKSKNQAPIQTSRYRNWKFACCEFSEKNLHEQLKEKALANTKWNQFLIVSLCHGSLSKRKNFAWQYPRKLCYYLILLIRPTIICLFMAYCRPKFFIFASIRNNLLYLLHKHWGGSICAFPKRTILRRCWKEINGNPCWQSCVFCFLLKIT